jgi:hypothetical protein
MIPVLVEVEKNIRNVVVLKISPLITTNKKHPYFRNDDKK